MSIFLLLESALLSCQPEEKCTLSLTAQQLCSDTPANSLRRDEIGEIKDFRLAGHPQRPELVPPSRVTNRKLTTIEGYAALLHAVCHIEFNAINLALDAAYRFRLLPEEFTRDWVRIAAEEAKHFQLMRQRLQATGYDYGDFSAHNHLWDMAY